MEYEYNGEYAGFVGATITTNFYRDALFGFVAIIPKQGAVSILKSFHDAVDLMTAEYGNPDTLAKAFDDPDKPKSILFESMSEQRVLRRNLEPFALWKFKNATVVVRVHVPQAATDTEKMCLFWGMFHIEDARQWHDARKAKEAKAGADC